jgi:tetratricopeptide (TPR) repeat protein
VSWIKEHIDLFLAGAGGVVLAVLLGWFKDFLKQVLPTPTDAKIWIVENLQDLRRIRPSPDKFLILVARLDGDDSKGTHTRAVARAFQGQQGIERTQTVRILSLSGIGSDAEAHAVATGRKWLARRKADLLIWGEVLQKEKSLNLWFTSKDATSEFQQSRFPLEANLLDGGFTEVARAQITSMSLSAIKPATEIGEQYLRNTLRPVADRLQNLLHDPSQFTLRQRSELAFALGALLCATAREEGGAAKLEDAVNLLTSSIENIDRTREPLAWANVQHYRGLALAELGEETFDPQTLNDAVTAFRSALDERTKERAPLDWAKTQHALGNTFLTSGQLGLQSKYLIEAIAAFDAARTERTQERLPAEWASTTSSRAFAVLMLGLRDIGTTQINEAIVSFQAALDATSPSSTPTLWGGIKLNLGLAFLYLAERQSERGALDEALTTLRSIFSVWSREEVPKLWVRAQLLIGTVLTRLGERETDSDYFDEAKDVLNAALEVCTPELSVPLRAAGHAALGWTLVRMAERELELQIPLPGQLLRFDLQEPTHWVNRQQDLTRGVQRIQQRENGISHLEEAINAFRNSLGAFPRERSPAQWAEIQHNFATALVRLGEQQEDKSCLIEALSTVNLALQVWTYEFFPREWALAQSTLSLIFIRLGERQEKCEISEFERAVAVCRKALQVQTRDNSPLTWARTQNYLGIALFRIGEAQNDLTSLYESARAYSLALEVLRSLSAKEREQVENNARLVEAKMQQLSSSDNVIDRSS